MLRLMALVRRYADRVLAVADFERDEEKPRDMPSGCSMLLQRSR
jgi:hypothetical protein